MAKKKKTAMESLPVYEMVFDETDTVTGVRFVSIVDSPAIEVKGKYFNSHKDCKHDHKFWTSDEVGYLPPCHPECQCEIVRGYWLINDDACDFCYNNKQFYDDRNLRFKQYDFSINKDQQVIAGPAMIPDQLIYRNDNGNEYYISYTADTIKRIVKKLSKENNNRSINLDHTNQMVKGYIMESWIVKDSSYDGSKAYGFDLPVGSWFITVQIEDEQFWTEEVKEKGKFGFSIEGIFSQKLVQMMQDFTIEEVIDSLTEQEIQNILTDFIKK